MRIELPAYTSNDIQFTINDTNNNPIDIKQYNFSAKVARIDEGDQKNFPKNLVILPKDSVVVIKWPPMKQGKYSIEVIYTHKLSHFPKHTVFLDVWTRKGIGEITLNPSNRYYGEGTEE